jgi:hypothetical protein
MKHQSIACFTNAVLVLAGLSVCFTIENPNTFHPPSHVTVTAPH